MYTAKPPHSDMLVLEGSIFRTSGSNKQTPQTTGRGSLIARTSEATPHRGYTLQELSSIPRFVSRRSLIRQCLPTEGEPVFAHIFLHSFGGSFAENCGDLRRLSFPIVKRLKRIKQIRDSSYRGIAVRGHAPAAGAAAVHAADRTTKNSQNLTQS